jgi:DNA-binding response OmpR family regulator
VTTPPRLGRILAVEDEPNVAELIRYNLAREGYDVRVTASGADALRFARETRPELVLLDVMVPQLSGWEVCQRLKQDAETGAVPIIMVTGRACGRSSCRPGCRPRPSRPCAGSGTGSGSPAEANL